MPFRTLLAKSGISLVAALAVAAFVWEGQPAQAQQSYVEAGVLTCEVSGAIGLIITSKQTMTCTYKPAGAAFGVQQKYTGTIRKFGLDVGITGAGVIIWTVLTAVQGVPQGALAGKYVGATAQASVVVGLGANALIGGSNKGFALQPFSVSGQTGLNLAIGVAELDLYTI
jgi:Protein of unknown function (DUF992)